MLVAHGPLWQGLQAYFLVEQVQHRFAHQSKTGRKELPQRHRGRD
jgi:hypothetical protein